MPEVPEIRFWYMFVPWKYPTRWSQFRGWYGLLFAPGVLTLGSVGGFLYIGVLSLGACAIMIVDIAWVMRVQNRKYKQTMIALTAWAKVIDGSVKQEELPPEVQEEIAVERALARTRREARD